MYNYLDTMKSDVLEAIRRNYTTTDYTDRDEMQEALYDDLWIDDSVTGNASGSYYCNLHKAREAVLDNMDLAAEALRELCVDAEEIGRRFLDEEWEWLDVTIRCYYLGQAIGAALDEMEEAGELVFETDDAPDAMGAMFDRDTDPETATA